jgi:hyaluronan synthase
LQDTPLYFKLKELDKKGWLVRILILSAVLVILVIKMYLAVFVIDRAVGLYSVLTSFLLFNVLIFSYFKYKDPYVEVHNIEIPDDKLPLVSIVIPVKNEEENIEICVRSALEQTYEKKEIIVINDGSTDNTGNILHKLKRDYKVNNFTILDIENSIGKKRAIEEASKIAKGSIYAFMDSDCNMDLDATEKAVKIMYSDPQIGAVATHIRVRNNHKGKFFEHFLEKCQDVYADASSRAIKGYESSFSSVTCCSGALSFYRREAIQNFFHEWAHDKFLGIEFKFCTDRRMTAHVLTTKPPYPIKELEKNHNGFIGKNNQKIKSKDDVNGYWKIRYSQHIRVTCGVPSTLLSLVKQQIRWRKSFIRSIFSTGGYFWKRPFYLALLYYLQTSMRFFRPYVVAKTVFLMPFFGDYLTPIVWFSGILFTGMILAVDFRLRNPGDKNWLYRPFFSMISTFIYTWLIFYAAITIRKSAWR